MIEYYSETAFSLSKEQQHTDWIKNVIKTEGGSLGRLSYVFCSDEYLLGLNKRFLDHDTLTDIITFPLNEKGDMEAEVYMSIPRIEENAKERGIEFDTELRRVMVHGVLHLLGYKDATKTDKSQMRKLEDKYIALFHVEQKKDV